MSDKPASKSADMSAPDNRYRIGYLQKTDTGRWSIGENWELTSGEVFEVRVADVWIQVRMEYGPNGYYVTLKGIVLYEGMEVRQRCQ